MDSSYIIGELSPIIKEGILKEIILFILPCSLFKFTFSSKIR